jgi:hypothetical protein
MKSLILSFVLASTVSIGFAQEKTETLKFAGECGTCKNNIETASKKEVA